MIALHRHVLPCMLFPVLETKTEILGPGFTYYKISDLLYGRTYIFTIRPLYGEVEGPISTVYQRICETLFKGFYWKTRTFQISVQVPIMRILLQDY